MHFRQENSPSTDYGTLFLYQTSFLVHTWFICSLRVSAVSSTVRLPWSVNSSVRRPFFAFSRPGHSCLSYGFRHTLPRIRIAPVNQTVLAHIVLLWLSASSPWSKHRVIICSLHQLWIALCISFANCFHLNSSFVNIKNILTPSGRTKTKLDNKRKSTHPSPDECYLRVSSLLSLQESFMSAEYLFVRFPYSAIITRGLNPCNKEGKHLLLERHFSFVILIPPS